MADNMDVDMMDIDDDFSDDELDAYFQAHGLDGLDGEGPPPSAQRQPGSDLGRNSRGGNSRWKGKGKAGDLGYGVDLGRASDEDDELEVNAYFQAHNLSEDLEPYQDQDRPPPSYQPRVQPRVQQQPSRSSGRNFRWKGKGNAVGHGNADGLGNPAGFGRGDVLGRDGGRRGGERKVRAWLERGDDDGDDEGEAVPLGRPTRPSKVLSPSPSPDPTLGSSPPVLSGLSIRNKDDTNITASQTKLQGQTNVEGQAEAAAEAALPDPYDSEASIAARPIVSHDPDHPNRPIDVDVKAARGVIRHVLVSEKFPEVWPVPEAEAEGEAGAQKEGQKVVEGSKAQEGQKGLDGLDGQKGQKSSNSDEQKGQEKKAREVGRGVEGKMTTQGQKEMGKEKEMAKRADGSKEQTGKKEVVIPKGVVMLVRGIQYLKMPPDTPSGSEAGSEYGYEGDSQGGSTPPSEFWSEEPRAPGNEGGEKVCDEACVDDSGGHTGYYSDDEGERDEYGEHSVERPSKELDQEIQETDFSCTSQPSTIADSDIPMSNTDYLPPPSSQIPVQPQSQSQSQSSLSLKRTWSQRHDHHPSDPSSPSSPSSPSASPSDPYYDDLYQNIPPPPRPPSSSSLPSQPPTGPPNLLIRLLLDDGEFWVQAILRPEFHHLVLGYDFDEWGSDSSESEGEGGGEGGKAGKVGGEGKGGGKGEGKGGKDGKEKTEEEIAKEEEEKEQEMQEKWQTKWEEKARGEVTEGVYVRLVGEVVVEFEEVDVDDELQPQPQPQPMKNDNGVSKGQGKEKGINGVKEVKGKQAGWVVKRGVKDRGRKMDIDDDGVGDPEKLKKLRREAMERKWLGKGKEVEGKEKAMVAKGQETDKQKEDEKPKTTKMVCLVVGHMVPVGWDRKYMREMTKAQLKAMEEELGPDSEVSSTTGDEMDLDTKDEKSKNKNKEPEKPKPWWVETGYRAELEEKKRKREAENLAKEAKERAHISDKNDDLTEAQKANPSEMKRPDPRKVLPPEWANLTIFEVDRLLKEWDKQNKPKEPKPPKPPKPVKKPIITARQAPQFRSSITAQEIFQLQNPDRKPPAKVPGPVYVPAEVRALRRPVAIENNQQIQRKIKELPPRAQSRLKQEQGPRPRPHLQPNPLLQPPQARPQARAQIQPRPRPYSVAQPQAPQHQHRPQPRPQYRPQPRPQPQLQPQHQLRVQPQLQPQLPPQPFARPHFQPQAQARPQFLQRQQSPQRPPQLQPQPRQQPHAQPQIQPQPQPRQPTRLPPQPPPLPPPKPNPHLATDPTIPLKLCSLRQIPHLPYAQNWMINVLAIIVSISPVEPSPMPPTFTQRTVRLADQSTSKHVLLNVFLDAEEFNPRPGEVVLLMGVKNHRFEGGCLKKYFSDQPPEGCKWRWWVGEEVLGGIGWCKGVVRGLRGWWREKEQEREREREREEERGRERRIGGGDGDG